MGPNLLKSLNLKKYRHLKEVVSGKNMFTTGFKKNIRAFNPGPANQEKIAEGFRGEAAY